MFRFTTFRRNKLGAGQTRRRSGQTRRGSNSARVKLGAGQTRRRSGQTPRRSNSAQVKLGAGQTRRKSNSSQSESAQKKNELTLLYSARIKNKNRTHSLAFNGNSLRLEHDCIFALPLRISVNHSHTFKVTILRSTSIKKNQHQLKIKILSDLVDCLLRYQCSIAIKYCISVIATHRSPAAFTRSLGFVSCKNGCVTINKAATCDTSLQVLCNAPYVKTKHC